MNTNVKLQCCAHITTHQQQANIHLDTQYSACCMYCIQVQGTRILMTYKEQYTIILAHRDTHTCSCTCCTPHTRLQHILMYIHILCTKRAYLQCIHTPLQSDLVLLVQQCIRRGHTTPIRGGGGGGGGGGVERGRDGTAFEASPCSQAPASYAHLQYILILVSHVQYMYVLSTVHMYIYIGAHNYKCAKCTDYNVDCTHQATTHKYTCMY